MKEYFISSYRKMHSVKYLALMAVFVALKTATSGLFIPVAENLRISLSFLFMSVAGAILGPVAGMITGAIGDIVGYMMFPTGAFFIGYTISAMAGPLVYALFLYRQKITIPKLILAKAVNNYVVNVLMGSCWSAMLYSKGYLFYFTNSLIMNTLLLPLEIIGLIAVFNLILPLLNRRDLISPRTEPPIRWK